MADSEGNILRSLSTSKPNSQIQRPNYDRVEGESDLAIYGGEKRMLAPHCFATHRPARLLRETPVATAASTLAILTTVTAVARCKILALPTDPTTAHRTVPNERRAECLSGRAISSLALPKPTRPDGSRSGAAWRPNSHYS